MRSLVVLVAAIALCAGSPTSVTPGDNSHYVEGESRYIWMPDGEGVPHLVDLHERPSQEEMSRMDMTRTGANNQYWLFTRQNPTNRQVINLYNNYDVWGSNYNPHRPLKVIVHGWNSNGESSINPLLTAAFLHVSDCNVIVVDWRRLANRNYWSSASGVPSVGRYLGDFLHWLISTHGGNWDQIHLVGFSLGAHIVGNAGRTVNGRISRITGLDPAGPTWGGNSNALRASDGQYVEAIHTDGGSLGIFDPIGRANFYPNGGRNAQPGCWISTCSHSRAYKLMESSIYYSNRFASRSCATLNDARRERCDGHVWVYMGNAVLDKRADGIFGVRTSNRWPF